MLVFSTLGCLMVLLGGAWGQSCGCTSDTLPHPRIVLLGQTGVGKSTFGNRLLGVEQEEGGQEALCSELGSPHKFGVGHRTVSHTNRTTWIVGHYLGDHANPCITIIDTPGTGDTEGRDCDHGIALAEGVKAIGSVDAFIMLFNGELPRFSEAMQEQVNRYTNIFGNGMWHNMITEFTYWAHDRKSIKKRKKNRFLNETVQHDAWNNEYSSRFKVQIPIPTVFIDPVFDAEEAYQKETEIDKGYTDTLWTKITQEFKPFSCDRRCQAPSGFFSGEPWTLEETLIQNKRIGEHALITWQIWFDDCDGLGTKSYKIYQTIPSNNETTPMISTEVVDEPTIPQSTPILVYENVAHEDDIENHTKHITSIDVVDEPSDKFKTIRLIINSTEDENFGSYYLENERGKSRLGKLNKIVDGEWEEWGPYGSCSKTCVNWMESPGHMTRIRKCREPRNGGLNCTGDPTETKECAHRPGDDNRVRRPCPIDAKWSAWSSIWSDCNGNCKRDEETPQRMRSRICRSELYGGKDCSFLEEQAIENKRPVYVEKQACNGLPTCPRPASLGPWSQWSPCDGTCYSEETSIPQTVRRKQCLRGSVSSDSRLNKDIATCESLGEVNEYKNCDTVRCPVEATWTDWGIWTGCSSTCGSSGTRSRIRTFIPGKNGANIRPEGENIEEEACNLEECPVPAVWTWSAWTACDITCYHEDGWRGMRTRNNTCTEDDPKHSTENCESPRPTFEMSLFCPGIPQCPDKAFSKTVEGEQCDTECGLYGYKYYWCRFLISGGWNYCSKSCRHTKIPGQVCSDACAKWGGTSYYWCHVGNSWEKCSPCN